MDRPHHCVTIERTAEHSYRIEYWQPRNQKPVGKAEITMPAGLAELCAIGTARAWAKLHNCELVTVDDGKIIRG